VASWDAPSPTPDLLVDKVVSLHHQSGTGTTCLILEGGDIVTVQDDHVSHNGAHIEIVGSIDAGIAAARWAPDEELVAVVTKANTVVFMGSTFDPIAEVNLTAEDLKASKHVSVGWGKKETQFEGRGVKALRDPTIPEKVDEGILNQNDDGAVSISWRGDGAFVAINAIESGRRVIRVYSREGELDSASEPVDGLESTLSWRPAGNLIAGIQRRPDRTDVVFFERNGLRHGEFTLRSTESPITPESKISLQWNADSSVLAISLDKATQLWTMGNYHWYLKQEIPTGQSLFTQTEWHPEKALRYVIATSENLILAEQVFHTSRSSCQPPFDNGAVAVIDGQTVKLTPIRTANVPPPMALFEVTAKSSVVDVAFGRRNESFAILHHRGVDLYDWPVNNGRCTKPQHRLSVPFESANIPDYHIGLWITCNGEDQFRCMNFQEDLGHLQLGIAGDVQEGHLSAMDDSNPLPAAATYEDESSIEGYAQDRLGKLYRLSYPKNEALHIQFPTLLPFFKIAKVEGELIAFGLSRNGHIYANSRVLAKNCTSFVVTPSHLILTTNNHFVKYVHLVPNVEGQYIHPLATPSFRSAHSLGRTRSACR
jgi:elongator complex protein 1